jgi:hypothetical protein
MSGSVKANASTGGPRAIVVDVLLNVAAPYLVYAGLHNAGYSQTRALMFSAIVPACVAVASLVRRRRIDGLSLLVLAGTGLSLAATALSGSLWFALIQPSFVTGSMAVLFLASLLAEKPVLFYLARDTTCPTPEQAREFESRWVDEIFRRVMRRLTLVWAAFLGGEALFRAALAAIWPNPTLVAATQILWIVLPILLVHWSIRAGPRWAAAARRRDAAPAWSVAGARG